MYVLELTANPLIDRRDVGPITCRRTARRRFARGKREAAAVDQIRELPDRGEGLVMIMTGTFHGWDLVAAVLRLAGGAEIEHLRVATLGFNRAQTLDLGELIDAGRIRRLTMVVSEMFREKNRSEFKLLDEEMTRRGQVVRCDRNHAKLLCFELNDGRRLVSHGSLNLRRCKSYEQVVMSHDEKLHDFFAAFIDRMASRA